MANATATVVLPAVRDPEEADVHVFQWIGTANALAEKSKVSARKPSTRISGSSMRLAFCGTAIFMPQNNLPCINTMRFHDQKTIYELSGIPAHKNPTALPFLEKSTTVSTVYGEEQVQSRL
ncbi:MAG TPA: hypothetical protein VJ833_01780 [Rhodanobacteraceae bacterium]|nr:hypothetical protein [Rhodanobacteraceae bacterium]